MNSVHVIRTIRNTKGIKRVNSAFMLTKILRSVCSSALAFVNRVPLYSYHSKIYDSLHVVL